MTTTTETGSDNDHITAPRLADVVADARRFARDRWATGDVNRLVSDVLRQFFTNAGAGDDAPVTVRASTSPRECDFYADTWSRLAAVDSGVVTHHLSYANVSPITLRLVLAALRRRSFSVAARGGIRASVTLPDGGSRSEADCVDAWLAGGVADDVALTAWRQACDSYHARGPRGPATRTKVKLVISYPLVYGEPDVKRR